MNIVCVTGNLGADPEFKTFEKTDTAVCNMRLAVNNGKDSDGNNLTVWLNLKLWGKKGEGTEKGLISVVKKFVKKGSTIGISGKLDVESWEKDGEKREKTVVVVDKLDLLGGKSDASSSDDSKKSSSKDSGKSSGTESGKKARQDFDDSDVFDDDQDQFS